MGLTNKSEYLKIVNALIAAYKTGEVTVTEFKMPSFDPRTLNDPDNAGQKLLFDNTELHRLKRFWGGHWQQGLKNKVYNAVKTHINSQVEKSTVEKSVATLLSAIQSSGLNEAEAINLLYSYLKKVRG